MGGYHVQKRSTILVQEFLHDTFHVITLNLALSCVTVFRMLTDAGECGRQEGVHVVREKWKGEVGRIPELEIICRN